MAWTLPDDLVAELAGCATVAVVAGAHGLGQARLLPDSVAWGYLEGRGVTVQRPSGPPRRLVVSDARPPDELGLPGLPMRQVRDQPEAGEQVVWLRGREATPARVLASLAGADEIEIHAHGLPDAELIGGSALALSPDDEGQALLTAGRLRTLALQRRPGVILGACWAARAARYGARHISLPAAFLYAGARHVFAAPVPVDDAEADEFFAGLRTRLRAGNAPAIALRDERQAPRWRASRREWTRDVILFE